ncbi:hypothetical protein V8D89_002884 [Ganoderma adspersum]
MQLTFGTIVKLTVFAIVANMDAVVALPEPNGLAARQGGVINCLAEPCNTTDGCCGNASCTGVSLPGSTFDGVCTSPLCDVMCSETVPCCPDTPDTTFTCQLISGQTVGVCIPQTLY